MKSISLALPMMAMSLNVLVADPGEPPVQAPYGDKLDTAASNKWWQVARGERQVTIRPHKPGSVTVTGRHFLNLEVPRDEVVAFALYTVANKTLKLSAQLYPLFPKESREVRLEVKQDGKWKEIAKTKVNDLGWAALFRVEQWNEDESVPYRVRHGEKAVFTGTVRQVPKAKEEIVVASLSCNSSKDSKNRDFYVKNILKIDPDLLFFAGDQHYDHTEHTAGWLMWGAQFKEILRDRPVVTILDDHDIGQGNLWGEGGIVGKGIGNGGGYIYHHDYVKQIHRCQTSHLPDPYDPTPIAQGIGVYYTNYNLGGVDFAILEDRKFKTGPNGKIPRMGKRPDHIYDPNYEPSKVDLPGLKLLGERQLKFLHDWGDNWKGVQMKAVLSQTPFSGTAHLHGGNKESKRLHADLDSNGWPQTPRNNALKAIRKGFACHLSGDQHLATIVQYGVEEHNDGPWSLVSPAIVNSIYGRFWSPKDKNAGANKPKDAVLPWTGEYLDGFNNKLTMHAYANPGKSNGSAAGFAVARFNKKNRTVTMECWPRKQDISQEGAKQFAGWPKTVSQISNFRPTSWGSLGEISFDVENPVVQLVDTETNEVVYTIRIQGKSFAPHAPKGRTFHLKAGKEEADKIVIKGASVESAKARSVVLP